MLKRKNFIVSAFAMFVFISFCFLSMVSASEVADENNSKLSTQKVAVQGKYDYLIIVPESWIGAVKPLAEWKTLKGVPTYVATVEDIEGTYMGKDLAWKIREFIKDSYMKWQIRYVLLAGDVGFIPTRYVHNPDTAEGDPLLPYFPDGTLKPTDWYYAGLDGTWDDDGDGIYGESSEYSIKDEMDWEPEIAIGRLPANSYSELQAMVNKIINYEKFPADDANWYTTAIFCGAPIKLDGEYWEDFGVTVKETIGNMLPDQMNILKFYHNTVVNNISRSDLIDALNGGASVVNVMAHGSPRAFYDVEWWSWILPDPFLGASDVPNLNNNGKPPLIFALSCLTTAFDIETAGAWWYRTIWGDTSLAEEFVKHPTGGAIAYIGWSRVTWTVEETETFFWSNFLNPETGNFRAGLSLLYAKKDLSTYYRSYLNDQIFRKVYASWHLLGDPELPIWTDQPKGLQVSYPSKVGIGQSITVKTVPDATVCIFDKNRIFYEVLHTDSEGKAYFTTPNYETVLSLVVTAHNHRPVELYDVITVENYVIIDKVFISDQRCDVGSTQVVAFHAKWALDGSDVVGGYIYINGTGYVTNSSGWVTIHATYYTVGKRSWHITGVYCNGRTIYEKIVNDPVIIWDRVQIALSVVDSRIDVGSTGIYTWSGVYEYDNHPFVGKIFLNDTLTKNKVGKYSYTVSEIQDDLYGLSMFTSNSFYIIFDKVTVQISIAESRINVNDSVQISWRGWYQYDMEPFEGTIFLNDSLTKNSVGKYGYKAASIIDDKYGITVFDTNEVSCIFDRITTRIETVSLVPGKVKIKIFASFEYDSSPVKEAIVTVNGVEATETGEGNYETIIYSWTPILGINVKVEKLEFTTATSILHYSLGNTLVIIVLPVVILVVFLYLYTKRKHALKNRKQWYH